MITNLLDLNQTQNQSVNSIGAVPIQYSNSATTAGYANYATVVPEKVMENPTNNFVYGTKYRAILAAEGCAVADSFEWEMLIRNGYLKTIVDIRVFNSVEEAFMHLMFSAVSYGGLMLGAEMHKYFNWPGEMKVNTIHYFEAPMVEKIASKKFNFFDKRGLPLLNTVSVGAE